MSQRGVEQSGMKNLEIHAAYRVNCILEFASMWIFSSRTTVTFLRQSWKGHNTQDEESTWSAQ